jgi:hypothetical protein
MELAQALQNAFHILEEERVRPTLNYQFVTTEWPGVHEVRRIWLKPQGYTPAMAAIIGLGQMRGKRPREVEEDPKAFRFESVNFTLLVLPLEYLDWNDVPEVLGDYVGGNEVDLVESVGPAAREHAAGIGTPTEELGRLDLNAHEVSLMLDGKVVVGHFAQGLVMDSLCSAARAMKRSSAHSPRCLGCLMSIPRFVMKVFSWEMLGWVGLGSGQ